MNTHANPTPLFSRQFRENIAQVVNAEAGQALTISLSNRIHRVAGHLSQVDSLQQGDRVLVSKTDCGYVITGRLRNPLESIPLRLMMENGTLTLAADQAVCLKTGNSRIEIQADGTILLNCNRIHSHAHDKMCFESATIEFN